MNWIDYIPCVSQVKSVVQIIKKDKEGAKVTQENFLGNCIGLIEPHLLIRPCPSYYCTKSRSKAHLWDWMKGLSDSMPITHVSIPGTHDSGCRTGGQFAKCQSFSIGEQLKVGIRFFDIRVRNVKNKFIVCHGIINCHLKFEKVLRYCENFLEINSTEFVVMRIRQEASSIYATKTFDEVYRMYASRKVFYQGNVDKVTVKDVRGKIFVLKDFPGEGVGHEWSFHNSILQDNFEPRSVYTKLKEIYEHHKYCIPDSKFNINFLSACSPRLGAWPRNFARICNKMFYKLIQDPEKRKFSGIVAIDFPGIDLIKEIVTLNNLN